jgi:predicted AAA+ superfamily ATPase
MQIIDRGFRQIVERKLAKMPAVALLGPRQCGKTTLSKLLGKRCFDLELDSARTRVDIQWDELMSSQDLLVFDEAQAHPPVFSRNIVDEVIEQNKLFPPQKKSINL